MHRWGKQSCRFEQIVLDRNQRNRLKIKAPLNADSAF